VRSQVLVESIDRDAPRGGGLRLVTRYIARPALDPEAARPEDVGDLKPRLDALAEVRHPNGFEVFARETVLLGGRADEVSPGGGYERAHDPCTPLEGVIFNRKMR
jgi:hypothetical protein